jgi:hypothetical protein
MAEEQGRQDYVDKAKAFEQIEVSIENSNLNISSVESMLYSIQNGVFETAGDLREWVESLDDSDDMISQNKDKLFAVLDIVDELGFSGAELQEILLEAFEGVVDGVNQYANLMGEVETNSVGLVTSIKNTDDELRSITEEVSNVSDELIRSTNIQDKILDLEKEVEFQLNKTAQIYEDRLEISSNIVDETFDLQTNEEGITDSLEDAVTHLMDQIKLQRDVLGLLNNNIASLEKELANKEKIGDLTKDQVTTIREIIVEKKSELDVQSAILDREERSLDVVQRYGAVYRDSVSTLTSFASDMQSSLDSFVSSLPAGDFISNRLGLGGIGDAITENLNGSFENFMSLVTEDGVSGLQALTTSVMGFGRGLMAALGPVTIIAGILAGLVAVMVSLEGSTREIAKNFGVSNDQAGKLLGQAARIQTSLDTRLSTFDDVLEVMEKMVEVDGMTVLASDKVIGRLSDMSKQLGYGADLAVQFHDTIADIGASDEAAANMQLIAARAAEASGFTSQLIIQDIVDNADELSEYFMGMPEDLIMTALETRKLGLDVKKVTRIADSLLDIESSLTAQFEASAALGRQINLDKARQLAFEGDLAGVAKEVANQVGSRQELEAMSVHHRRLLAQAVGMEYGEIVSMLDIQEKRANLTEEELQKSKEYESLLGDVSHLNDKQYQTLLGQTHASQEFSASWAKIKTQLITAIYPIVESIANSIGDLTPLIQPVIAAFKVLSGIIKFISPLIKGFMLPFKLIGQAIEKINSLFSGTKDATEEVQASLFGIGDILSKITSFLFTGIGAFFGGRFLYKKLGGLFSFITSGFKLTGKKAGAELTTSLAETATKATKGGLFSNLFSFKNLSISKMFGSAKKEVISATKDVSKVASSTLQSSMGANLSKIKLPSMKGVFSKFLVAPFKAITGGKLTKTVIQSFSKVKSLISSKNALGGISEVVTSNYSKIISNVSGFVGGLSKTVMSIGGNLFKSVSSVMPNIKNLVGGSLTKIAGSFSSFMTGSLSKIVNFLPVIRSGIVSIGPMLMRGLSGVLPSITKMLGSIGGTISSSIKSINSFGAKKVAGVGAKQLAKSGGKTVAKKAGGGILKSLGKKIPGLSLLIGGGLAVSRLMKGDLAGAGLELASGAASTIPGIGTAASLGLDAAIMARDMSRADKVGEASSDADNLTGGSNQSLDQMANAFGVSSDHMAAILANNTGGDVNNSLLSNGGDSISDIQNNSSVVGQASNQSISNLSGSAGINNSNLISTISSVDEADTLSDSSVFNSNSSVLGQSSQISSDLQTASFGNNFAGSTTTNNNQQNTPQSVDMRKVEQLLMELLKAQVNTSDRPVQVNIGDQEIRKINSKIRVYNAQ